MAPASISASSAGSHFVYDDESDDDDDAELTSAMSSKADGKGDDGDAAKLKREHKRLKHWGKKNKKLRDKTPYGEDSGSISSSSSSSSYGAFTTNRAQAITSINSACKLNNKVKRNDPRIAYGTPFTRSVLPHHNISSSSSSSSSSSVNV